MVFDRAHEGPALQLLLVSAAGQALAPAELQPIETAWITSDFSPGAAQVGKQWLFRPFILIYVATGSG